MVSLLVGVFLIQLACHIVQTVGAKPINDLVRVGTPPLCWTEIVRDNKVQQADLWRCPLCPPIAMEPVLSSPRRVVAGNQGAKPAAARSGTVKTGDEGRVGAGRVF